MTGSLEGRPRSLLNRQLQAPEKAALAKKELEVEDLPPQSLPSEASAQAGCRSQNALEQRPQASSLLMQLLQRQDPWHRQQ